MKCSSLFSFLTIDINKLLFFVSLFIISFGQPASIPFLGLISSCVGHGLYWICIHSIEKIKQRFYLSSLFFGLSQIIQLYWLTSHYYGYIYIVLLALSLILGIQYGIIACLISSERIKKLSFCFAIAGLWVIFEWSRLYFLAGFSLNPVGLALTSQFIPLQLASCLGIYGLSFVVILCNALFYRSYVRQFKRGRIVFGLCAIFPYVFGMFHYLYHHKEESLQKSPITFDVLLVQTGFPVEENHPFANWEQAMSYALDEWETIFQLIQPKMGNKKDLIVLPEGAVPFGKDTPLYPLEAVISLFEKYFGQNTLHLLPSYQSHSLSIETSSRKLIVVSNHFFAQGLANICQSNILIGLEETIEGPNQLKYHYNAAVLYRPFQESTESYAKQILIPMGEYLPFEFCRELASMYGIDDSFTPGKSTKVFEISTIRCGVCICSEETLGDLIRRNKQEGAEILINLTNDAWYPNSSLTKQHLFHALPRTVENGLPLIRACSTGITAFIDSFGRIIASLNETKESGETLSDTLLLSIPLKTYPTLYSKVGDRLIIGISLFALALFYLLNSFDHRHKAK